MGRETEQNPGQELAEMCKQEDWVIMSTYYHQRQPATRWHLRYRTAHQLDHFVIRGKDRWNVTDCRTYHFGSEATKAQREDGVWAWAPYTDHEPAGIKIRVG